MSTLNSLSSLFDTPALAVYRGVAFYTKASIDLAPSVKNTRIMTDAFGALGARRGDVAITVDLTPAGEWESAAYALLHPYTTLKRGMPIGVTRLACTAANINTATERLTIVAHGLANADKVYLGTTGVLPTVSTAALSTQTPVYAKAIDADTIELYEEVGLATKVNFTGQGTGSLLLTRDNPLHLYLLNYGQKLTLHNAALVGIPDLTAGATTTPFGGAKFEAFLRSGYAPGTAGSYFTFSEEEASDTSFDPASILTQPLSIAWGASFPWSDLDVAESVKVSFAMKATDVMSDTYGLRGKKLDDIDITATIKPRGVNAYQALARLAIESSRGSTRSLGTLALSGTGFYFQLYATDLEEAPHKFSGADALHGDFKLRGLRTVTAGAADPRYYVGTSAPA